MQFAQRDKLQLVRLLIVNPADALIFWLSSEALIVILSHSTPDGCPVVRIFALAPRFASKVPQFAGLGHEGFRADPFGSRCLQKVWRNVRNVAGEQQNLRFPILLAGRVIGRKANVQQTDNRDRLGTRLRHRGGPGRLSLRGKISRAAIE